MGRFFLISGCSGGGKSTLLVELKKRGHCVIEEPGRRIVTEEQAGTGAALPWIDMASFARRAIAMARSDLSFAERQSGFVFFDRGLVDAAVALEHAAGVPYRRTLGRERHYAPTVFLAPPWPEIYVQDGDRRHDLTAAVEEFERLKAALVDLGYSICLLPKASVNQRAEFLLGKLSNT
ncbi:AAA family ATPase [Algihabitans albus]|uniref:AAA family ATPase n=1 Tax=Algihabitans albus TaxID=2164067 RepID=UPI0035CF14BA